MKVDYPVTVAWAMPNRWTFQIPPIAEFVKRHTENARVIVDPFAGTSRIATHRNDLAHGGVDAVEYLQTLLDHGMEGEADVVIFDPPYSPRQITEAYASVGKKATMKDTQNARLYAEVKPLLFKLCREGGVGLAFGWQSNGLGKTFGTPLEMLIVQHGSAHNDTICVAQRKTTPIQHAAKAQQIAMLV